MYDIPIYHQEYQCDAPGSFVFKSTRMKLNQLENNELDKRIQIWNKNTSYLSPAMQQLMIDKNICVYIYQILRKK